MIRRRFHDNQTVQNTNRHISLSNLPDIEVANIMTMVFLMMFMIVFLCCRWLDLDREWEEKRVCSNMIVIWIEYVMIASKCMPCDQDQALNATSRVLLVLAWLASYCVYIWKPWSAWFYAEENLRNGSSDKETMYVFVFVHMNKWRNASSITYH